MRVSVILCTRNRIDEVIRFCESLYNQIELPDELIIVDSSDVKLKFEKRFTNFLKKWKGKIYINYLSSEPGLTKQRNIGVKEAKGDIIYFFDDDVILKKNYLKIINEIFLNKSDYIGGMGTIIGFSKLSIKKKIAYFFKSFFLLQSDYGDGKFQKSGFPKHPYNKKEFKEVEVLCGCCCYKKDIFKEFKFDENLTGYSYMEDVDFSRRVSLKYRLFYEPRAKLEHRHSKTERGNIYMMKKMYIKNYRYLFFKNFYDRNKLSILAHWWSILGLFLNSFFLKPKAAVESIKGYIRGLKEFKENRRRSLCN